MGRTNEKKIITIIGIVTLIINFILLALKITFGIIGKSRAVLTAAVDSGLDILFGIIIIIVGRISRKAKDREHPYGHERFESAFSIFFGVFMIMCGIEISIEAGKTIYYFSKGTKNIKTPNYLALIASSITIVTKLILCIITKIYVKKSRSQSLKALALDHLSDVLSNSVVLLGVLFSIYLKKVIFEPIVSLLLALFIIYNGIMLLVESIDQVVDKSVSKNLYEEMKKVIESVPGVLKVDLFKTRQFGLKIYCDIEIVVDRNLTVDEGHDIAENVHDLLEKTYPDIKHTMVHINPGDKNVN